MILGNKASAEGWLPLPNKSEYLMVFEKYTGDNEINETARIQHYDWNHNRQLFDDVSVTEGQVDFENFIQFLQPVHCLRVVPVVPMEM